MSTRFHDKWHGANHNSVSAIGIPDAGRDPIASYVFPFEGEFIMNNLRVEDDESIVVA